ncbi:MAG: phosphotransferase [Lentisphaeria bacterium]|nr:phosphotransferase [Lentisphaeria bacterium]
MIDSGELSATVAAVLGRRYRLTALAVKCTYPVFRGEADGVAPIFVKVGTWEEWSRTTKLLKAIGDCGLFSRFLTDLPIEYNGSAVFVMEWRESKIVFPEDMTERQIESFIAGCARMFAALQQARGALGITPPALGTPEGLYGDLLQYASRHSLAGRLLKGLVEIPEARRTYGTHPRVVCHGDFHAKNFGFVGGEFAAVYDFDKLTEGLGCSDLVNALCERFSCFHLSRAARRRLCDVTRRIVTRVPWPRDELVIACNIVRLQFAVRRILKHPGSAWVALDALRRDRRIREFLSCLEGLS